MIRSAFATISPRPRLPSSVSSTASPPSHRPPWLLDCKTVDHLIQRKMTVILPNVNSKAGLQKLNDYLLTRSYITGYQASKDDMAVFTALTSAPPSSYVNVTRWYNHISALLRSSGITAEGDGVKVEATCPVSSAPRVAEQKALAVDEDDDVDLFGEETEEEHAAAEASAAAVKASGKKKESGKSSILLDVKPWDDETDMQKLEEAVRSVKIEGLLWGASKLVPVGYGIKKMQILMTIVDDLVSVDSLIEDHLCIEPANEYIQSCDIVAFNKIFWPKWSTEMLIAYLWRKLIGSTVKI